MKRLIIISATCSFLLLMGGINVIVTNPNNKAVTNSFSQNVSVKYFTQNLPSHITYQIRHRSAEKIKTDNFFPNRREIHETVNHYDSPEYVSKWNNYFHFIAITLPDDQTTPPSLSLRSPPWCIS